MIDKFNIGRHSISRRGLLGGAAAGAMTLGLGGTANAQKPHRFGLTQFDAHMHSSLFGRKGRS
ncbi:MAG: twin-arginine translocation signal domain-containing protein [Enhydrobacter sp.]